MSLSINKLSAPQANSNSSQKVGFSASAEQVEHAMKTGKIGKLIADEVKSDQFGAASESLVHANTLIKKLSPEYIQKGLADMWGNVSRQVDLAQTHFNEAVEKGSRFNPISAGLAKYKEQLEAAKSK